MSKPLYQTLNEQRTQGEWETFEEGATGHYCIVTTPAPKDHGDIIFDAPLAWESSMKRWQANAQYTALAVNNLHHLAEALEKLLSIIESERTQNGISLSIRYNTEYELAKQALSRIS